MLARRRRHFTRGVMLARRNAISGFRRRWLGIAPNDWACL